MRVALGVAALVAAALLGASCDVARPDVQAVGPPLHLVSVTAGHASPVVLLKGSDTTPPAVLPTVPDTASFSLKFDRYLLPTAAVRASVCLQSDLSDLTKLADCKSGVLLHPQYDPVTRTVTYYLDAPLADGTYKLTIFSGAANDSGTGFLAFDRSALEKTDPQKSLLGAQLSVTFAATNEGTDLERPPVGPSFCNGVACTAGCEALLVPQGTSIPAGAGQILYQQCGKSCHAANPSQNLIPAMGLELDSVNAVKQTALGPVAHQTELGGHAAVEAKDPPRVGVSMPRISPGNPGNSYVLYKILANDSTADWDTTDTGFAAGEPERLRRSLVTGMAMPAQPFTLTFDEAETLSRWIAGGWLATDNSVVPGAAFRPCELPTP